MLYSISFPLELPKDLNYVIYKRSFNYYINNIGMKFDFGNEKLHCKQ